jgi:hypothetical protein
MVKVGLLALIEAKPESAADVEKLLTDALRLDATSFGIFDAFGDDDARRAHLEGRIAAALMEVAPTALASPPSIRPVDVLAAKLPG